MRHFFTSPLPDKTGANKAAPPPGGVLIPAISLLASLPILIFLYFLFPRIIFLIAVFIIAFAAVFLLLAFRKRLQSHFSRADSLEKEIKALRQEMEMRVSERTAEFTRTNLLLQKEVIEREKIEERLKENERRGRDLLNTIPGWMYRINAQGVYLEVIPGRKSFERTEEGDIIGKHLSEVLAPEYARERMLHIQTALKTGQPQSADKTRIVSGQRRYFEMQTIPVRKHETLTIIRDITDRKHTEIALTESRQRYQSLIEHSPDAIAVLMDGVLNYVNNSFLKLVGAESHENIIGEPLADFVHPAYLDAAASYIYALGKRGASPTLIESKFMRHDGASVSVETIGTAISLRGKPAIQLLIRDISQRKISQKEHRRLEERIMDAQKFESLGVLAGGVAHDFNNLLTTILGYAGFARMEMRKSDAVSEYILKIEEISRRAAELCRQMLAYSGRGQYIVRETDLTTLVEDIASLLHVSIFKKVRLAFDLEENPPKVVVDVTQIRQIILNLVINASESIGKNLGVVTISTGFQTCDFPEMQGVHGGADIPVGDYVFIEVADNGPGVAPEAVHRIFDPFFTTKSHDRGLGLAAVSSIVQTNKGAIQVQSDPGEGAVFRIFFPAVTAPLIEIVEYEAKSA